MVFAALERQSNPDDAEALRYSQYKVLQQWQNQYHGNLLVFLPDTYRTTQFLRNAPPWVSYWTGARPDSKEPTKAGEELLDLWKQLGLTAAGIQEGKLLNFSDSLSQETQGY